MKTSHEARVETNLREQLPTMIDEVRKCLDRVETRVSGNGVVVADLKRLLSSFVETIGLVIGDMATDQIAVWIGREFCRVILREPPLIADSVTDLRGRHVPHNRGGDPRDWLVIGLLHPITFCRDEDSPYHIAAVKLTKCIEDSGLREHFLDIE